MSKIIKLSDEYRKQLLDIAYSFGLSGNDLQDDRLENRNPEYAKKFLLNYLNGINDEKIIFLYLVIVMFSIKNG